MLFVKSFVAIIAVLNIYAISEYACGIILKLKEYDNIFIDAHFEKFIKSVILGILKNYFFIL